MYVPWFLNSILPYIPESLSLLRRQGLQRSPRGLRCFRRTRFKGGESVQCQHITHSLERKMNVRIRRGGRWLAHGGSKLTVNAETHRGGPGCVSKVRPQTELQPSGVAKPGWLTGS